MAAFYFLTSIYIASHRLFWYDEIVTVRIAALHGFSNILDALRHGADGTPPGYYFVAAASQTLFGNGEVAARLVSALAISAALLITFDYARRLTNGLHGLIALAAITCSYLPYYGYEARSYAIFALLAALSLWIWACTPNDRWLPATAFGAVLFCAVTVHYYAVLLLVPYGLWALYCLKGRELPGRKLIAGCLGVAIALLLMWQLMFAYSAQFSSAFAGSAWGPSFNRLRAIFPELFPDGLFLLALITLWIVVWLARNGTTTNWEPMKSSESVAWLFLAIPLAGFVLAEWKTHAFLGRYFVGVIPGVAVGFSCWLWRNFRSHYCVPLGIFLLLASWGIVHQTMVLRHPERVDPSGHPSGEQIKTRQYLDLEPVMRAEGKRYLVFSNSILHVEVGYYSQHPEQCVLLLDPSNQSVLTTMESNLARYAPLQFWSVNDLVMHASESALIEPTPNTLYLVRQLGLKTTTRFPPPTPVLYLQR